MCLKDIEILLPLIKLSFKYLDRGVSKSISVQHLRDLETMMQGLSSNCEN